MSMLNELIQRRKDEWLLKPTAVHGLLSHIKSQSRLRDTQIEAIETYLYLKIAGDNKPLWQLFSEGFFTDDIDLNQLNINKTSREFLESRPAAKALYEFAIRKDTDGKESLPEIAQQILENPRDLDYEKIIQAIFYGVNYPDYLMSLPMGAGKTFLMAAIIYLDLYFANQDSNDRNFAHNFLVLIPSGLKSSIAPSLRTIENFDPSWVVPEPTASSLKRQLSFHILDQQKTSKSSNKVRNPNAQKVSRCFPNPFATVFVVNAEKVILDRIDVVEKSGQQQVIEKTADERDRQANELRNLIGKIPNLSILIDEVHHAASDDIKLRQVVNQWQRGGNIASVLGFSGTPYLASSDSLNIGGNTTLKFPQITNTVYYYPLLKAINLFLKKPQVKIALGNADRLQIITQGINDFREQYADKIYADGAIAKIAIFCSNIETLEQQVYPHLLGELGIAAHEILKFHKGNAKYPQPQGAELAFRSLDLSTSSKRYILLVQIGKEGWDCRSLTGVILSQQGDCPQNMVLQTSCRCLRQVDAKPAEKETALIWLNDGNAKTLNQQLKKQQHTSIDEINRPITDATQTGLQQHSRMQHLQIPELEFCQLRVNYQSLTVETESQTGVKLQNLCREIEEHSSPSLIITTNFEDMENFSTQISEASGDEAPYCKRWLYSIAKSGCHMPNYAELLEFFDQLQKIYARITIARTDATYWNNFYNRDTIECCIRLAFHAERRLQTEQEIIPESAQLLRVEGLRQVDAHDKLYPTPEDSEKIRRYDHQPPTPKKRFNNLPRSA